MRIKTKKKTYLWAQTESFGPVRRCSSSPLLVVRRMVTNMVTKKNKQL
jgi:hypothetical protein